MVYKSEGSSVPIQSDGTALQQSRTVRILIVTWISPPDIDNLATYVPKIAEFPTNQAHQGVVLTLSDGSTACGIRYPNKKDTSRPHMIPCLETSYPKTS